MKNDEEEGERIVTRKRLLSCFTRIGWKVRSFKEDMEENFIVVIFFLLSSKFLLEGQAII